MNDHAGILIKVVITFLKTFEYSQLFCRAFIKNQLFEKKD